MRPLEECTGSGTARQQDVSHTKAMYCAVTGRQRPLTHAAEWVSCVRWLHPLSTKWQYSGRDKTTEVAERATLPGALRGEEGTQDMGDFGSSKLFFAIL